MPKIVNIKQRTPEWHAWRKNKISASMIPTLMGFNPHETPLQLWEHLQSGKEREINEHMQRGNDLEPAARYEAERKFGVYYPETCIESDEFPWMIASLDGYNANAGVRAIEIKCPTAANHQSAKLGVVPPQYYPQLQFQMYVAGLDEMYYISFISPADFETITVKRDDKFIEKMKPLLKPFRDCLISYIPPEPCDRDLIARDDQETLLIATELASIQEQEKELDLRKEHLRARLQAKCEDRSALIGDRFRFVKFMRKGSIDYGRIPELEGIDLEKYRKKPIESWRFS
jgi:putative phage-type endonuclease